jgi:hypothetical protein
VGNDLRWAGKCSTIVGTDFQGTNYVSAVPNGRLELLKAVKEDIAKNPLLGQGFGKFGRFTDTKQPEIVTRSSSAHIYWLTLLWKGGLLFAVPFFVMVGWMVKEVYWQKWTVPTAIVAAAILCAAFFSLFWDILAVSSVGSLTYLF